MSIKKYKRRKKRPSFRKFYEFTEQDEEFLSGEKLLQQVHSQIAEKLFGGFPYLNFGDWTIKTEGMILYIDPVFGPQAEIAGTSKLPLSKRLIIHIRLLNLLKENYSILKAVKFCINTLMTL